MTGLDQATVRRLAVIDRSAAHAAIVPALTLLPQFAAAAERYLDDPER